MAGILAAVPRLLRGRPSPRTTAESPGSSPSRLRRSAILGSLPARPHRGTQCSCLGSWPLIPQPIQRMLVSGNGGHIWLFLDQAIPAGLARKLGAHVLTETMERRPDIGLDSGSSGYCVGRQGTRQPFRRALGGPAPKSPEFIALRLPAGDI